MSLSTDEGALRSFCARVLGWSIERVGAVEHAFRSIEFAVAHRAALVLLGETDLVSIAHALHGRMFGAGQPFVVSNPRLGNMPASSRSPANYESAVEAIGAAVGGSLCVHRRRFPRDFPAAVALIREPDTRVQLVICGGRHDKYEALLEALAPILVPSLEQRAAELPRIVEEYAADAAVALSSTAPFTSGDRDWICRYCASSLHEIDTASLRMVALRKAGNVVGAARLLGMSHASLGEWFQRRRARRDSAPRRRASKPSPPRPRPNATRGHSIRRPSQ
jgi:hypothetical protein